MPSRCCCLPPPPRLPSPSRPPDPNLPAPGTRGNADNVPYIGKSDPKGNPVRLARPPATSPTTAKKKSPPTRSPIHSYSPMASASPPPRCGASAAAPKFSKFYETEIYGRVPDNAPKVTWEVTETDPTAREGAAILKRLVGKIGDKPDGPRMNMTLYLPAKATGPVPLLLSISFNFGVGRSRQIRTESQESAPADGKTKAPPPPRFDSIGEVLSRGWAHATLTYTDIQPDRPNQWTSGVIGQTLKEGQTQPAPDEWGTISAWAWGISRAIDYFETDKSIHPKQIAITGVSRLGKTVLWASAKDERIAAVFSVVSGEMGASLIRRDWGETLDDMAQNFGYQFAGNLQKWVGKWNDLPVDQHQLIALSAPRPVYVNGGLTDQWSDPKGEFLSMVAAGPVYRLLGKQDLGVTDLPSLDTPLTTGSLAFHYHSSGHTAVPADWKLFLDFATRHFQER